MTREASAALWSLIESLSCSNDLAARIAPRLLRTEYALGDRTVYLRLHDVDLTWDSSLMMLAHSRWNRPLAAACLALGVLAGTAATAANPTVFPGEEVPDADTRLTRGELRWCLYEPIRLDGAGNELQPHERWEVDYHNAAVDRYNRSCSSKANRQRDLTAVERELDASKRQALRQAGVDRVRRARADREGRRMFVKDMSAEVRLEPTQTGKVLDRVPRWGELIATGRTRGQWYEVEWTAPSLETALQFGWVLGGFVERGSGAAARFDYCEVHAGTRAGHNEIVRRRTDNTTLSSLSVTNGTGQDAYVKLVDQSGRLALSFLAAAGRTATISGIPSGSYEVLFATGSLFSRGCDSFSRRGAASQFSERLDYYGSPGGWEITLHGVTDGNIQAHSLNYDDFDRF